MSETKSEGLIFISWAGEVSKQVAVAFRELLKNTIHTATPWMSESDIDKGARWRSEIEKQLDAAMAGVIVLTPENVERPWLLFEAGALSKKNNRVYTYLFNIPKGQLGEPLSQFQDTTTSEQDTRSLVKSINQKLGAAGIEEERILKAFQHNWPEFHQALTRIPQSPSAPPSPPDAAVLMQEMLGYLRANSRDMELVKAAVANMYEASLRREPFTSYWPNAARNTLQEMATAGRYRAHLDSAAFTPMQPEEKEGQENPSAGGEVIK